MRFRSGNGMMLLGDQPGSEKKERKLKSKIERAKEKGVTKN